MLAEALKSLGIQLAAFFGVLAACALCTWGIDGGPAAEALVVLTVRDMLGPWVWTLGWGLARFIRLNAASFANDLVTVLEPSEPTSRLVSAIERSASHRDALRFTAPITALGFGLTVGYGVPLAGVGRWIVTLGVTSIYYVGAYLLCHFVGVIRGFTALYADMDDTEFRAVVSPIHLESALGYLSLTTLLGVAAIYAGFRGTLTAGFLFDDEWLQFFLVTPLVLFLPATLFYNFHPRYVLRRLVQHKMLSAMQRLSQAAHEDARSLVLEMRELSLTGAQVLPFIDYKTLPSYVISVLFVISLAYHNDPAVKAFVNYLLGASG